MIIVFQQQKMHYQYRSSINCKNHPEISAGYFLAEQPWQKFCSNCALNIALCGKKIEKQLSSGEFERKMALNSLITEFKSIIQKQGEINNNLTTFLQRIEQQYSKQLSKQMKNLQQYINILQKAKNQLFELYDKEVVKPINDYFERQSKIILQSMEIKRQIQYIQSNFGNLISNSNYEQFTQKVKTCNEILGSAKKQMQIGGQFSRLESNLNKVSNIFKQSFFLISNTTLNIPKEQKLQESFSEELVRNLEYPNRQEKVQYNSVKIQKEQKQSNENSNCTSARTQLKLRSKSKLNDPQSVKRKSISTPNTPKKRESLNCKKTSRHIILSLIQNAS